jgi:hypothetical protein
MQCIAQDGAGEITTLKFQLPRKSWDAKEEYGFAIPNVQKTPHLHHATCHTHEKQIPPSGPKSGRNRQMVSSYKYDEDRCEEKPCVRKKEM